MIQTERHTLERLAIENISLTLGSDFASPRVVRTAWSTRIAWLHSDIAVELEFDWRELEIFCLIVRLDQGNMPNGYYVSNGNPCRYHLEKLIKERKWNSSVEALVAIPKSPDFRHRSLPHMTKNLDAYNAVLGLCVGDIRREGHLIFGAC